MLFILGEDDGPGERGSDVALLHCWISMAEKKKRRKKRFTNKTQPKKSDPADALTVADVFVVAVLPPFGRGVRVMVENFFFLSRAPDDVVLWLFYGIRHKYNWRSWWSGKFFFLVFFFLFFFLFGMRRRIFPCCLTARTPTATGIVGMDRKVCWVGRGEKVWASCFTKPDGLFMGDFSVKGPHFRIFFFFCWVNIRKGHSGSFFGMRRSYGIQIAWVNHPIHKHTHITWLFKSFAHLQAHQCWCPENGNQKI